MASQHTFRMIADKQGKYHRVCLDCGKARPQSATTGASKPKASARPKAAPKQELKQRRYYVVRSLGGRTFQIGDREQGGVVRRGFTDKRDAERVARQMNRAGGYKT